MFEKRENKSIAYILLEKEKQCPDTKSYRFRQGEQSVPIELIYHQFAEKIKRPAFFSGPGLSSKKILFQGTAVSLKSLPPGIQVTSSAFNKVVQLTTFFVKILRLFKK